MENMLPTVRKPQLLWTSQLSISPGWYGQTYRCVRCGNISVVSNWYLLKISVTLTLRSVHLSFENLVYAITQSVLSKHLVKDKPAFPITQIQTDVVLVLIFKLLHHLLPSSSYLPSHICSICSLQHSLKKMMVLALSLFFFCYFLSSQLLSVFKRS